MLPSMPILFTRESQDAFGNKIQPSTSSFFGQNTFLVSQIEPTPPPAKPPPAKAAPKETKSKAGAKKKTTVPVEPLKVDKKAREEALVTSYYTKVQSRLASTARVPSNKFIKFQDLLKSFNVLEGNPIELFKQVEEFFGEENKDLAEEFLIFLSPGQAAEIGRFMDHFVLTQLKSFLNMLQTTFARKPAMLRKILRTISNSLNCSTVDEIRAKVLPLLRSSPRLTATFKSLFPDERPPDILYESGTDMLTESFLAEQQPHEVWELDDAADTRRNLDVKVNLDTMYLQGRVFLQHGRNLRPANITFPYSKEPYRVHLKRLAPTHCRISPPQSDDESPKKKTPKRQPKKSPKKSNTLLIKQSGNKDVNDNKPKKAPPKKIAKKKVEVKKKEIEWTRDEDKVVLQFMKGQSVSDQVFGKIKESLPHRSVPDIKSRIFHVINLVEEMKSGVT